jgi:hypothetical protein
MIQKTAFALHNKTGSDVFIAASNAERLGSLPALTLLSLAAVPCPPRHFELQPGFPGLDGVGSVLEARAAGFAAGHHWLRT